jgi:hypothetical protein
MQTGSDLTTMLISEQPPWFHRNNGPNHPAYDPYATVHAHAFLEALLGLIRPTSGVAASPLQPAAASGLARLLRDGGDDVAAPALDLGACPLLVGALRQYTPVTFSSSNTRTTSRWTTTLRREAAEALHCLATLQTPQGCGPWRFFVASVGPGVAAAFLACYLLEGAFLLLGGWGVAAALGMLFCGGAVFEAGREDAASCCKLRLQSQTGLRGRLMREPSG